MARTVDAISTIIIAAAVAISGSASQILLALLTNRARRDDKQRDWDRQDEVAARVERANEKAAAATKALIVVNEGIAHSNLGIATTVDTIHALVNSSMTQAIQSELDAIVHADVLMRELIAVHSADGHEASLDTLAALAATAIKITELRTVLDARIAQQAELAAAGPPLAMADVQPRIEALEQAASGGTEHTPQ